jgi:hypothetical protein
MATAASQGLDILAVWNDADPEHEAEYHRWYWGQHLPERLSVPGFLSAYRYQAVDARPKFFTWYFVRDIEMLRSPAYLARLASPTEWTQRVMPWFRNMTRCACRLTEDRGRGIGATTVVLRVTDPSRQQREAIVHALRESLSRLWASAEQDGMTRAQLWETDREISDQRTPERALRGGSDRVIDCAIVLHCPDADTARAAAGKLTESAGALKAAELDGPHIYSLLHSLSVVG